MKTLKSWEHLVSILNSDGSGSTKSIEKWKKVWSDLKNNIKKKAARLHRAATGTGGGLACFSKLSDLEQRVLNIIGIQVATGLVIHEAGLPQSSADPSTDIEDWMVPPHQLYIGEIGVGSQPWDRAGSSLQPHIAPPCLHSDVEQESNTMCENSTPRRPCTPEYVVIEVSDLPTASPQVPQSVQPTASQLHAEDIRPGQSGQMTPRHRPRRTPRRLVRLANVSSEAIQNAAAQGLHGAEKRAEPN